MRGKLMILASGMLLALAVTAMAGEDASLNSVSWDGWNLVLETANIETSPVWEGDPARVMAFTIDAVSSA